MILRPYQEQARAATFREWDAGWRSTLLVLPTGTGKTIVFSKIAEDSVRIGDRCLILAHRGELLDQARDKIAKSTGLACATEKAEQSCLGCWERIVVGSIQSMARPQRLKKFPPNFFDKIIVDEAHHVLSDSYQFVLGHFPRAKVLGVTATPDRGDQRDLGAFFGSIAFEYSLPEAIRDGYLSPIMATTIPLTLDISGVKTQAGDFQASALGTALEPYLEQIAVEMARNCQGRKVVVFLPLIDTAKKFRRILAKRGFRAVEVNGQSVDRAENLADFEAGHYDVLCNAMLLTEGWDCPSVDTIIVLRPTKVRSLYCQMVGRGTRLYPGKTHLLLMDFLWHTSRHDLCHPAHLICESDDVAKQMTTDLANSPGYMENIEAAAERATSETSQQREKYLAKQLAEQRAKKRQLIDPVTFGQMVGNDALMDHADKTPPSELQIHEIELNGISTVNVESAEVAEALLGEIHRRDREGLATPKQIRRLEKNYKFKDVANWPRKAAESMIVRIAAQGWKRVPPGVDPKTYKPE